MDASGAEDAKRANVQPAAPNVPNPNSATSQAFHQELPDAAVKRSLFVSALGSAIGMVMFSTVQGTVFNFFLSDLNLEERIPWFLGLQWLAGSGSIVGSWIQERWGFRRTLMFVCCGLTRIIWLIVGLLPVFWPEKIQTGGLFGALSVAMVLFYFLHSVGANAWLTWMSDLVPPKYQSRFWSWRQVFTVASSAIATFGFGKYLELHRNFSTYAILFAISTASGLIDVSCYFFVAHRRPKLVPHRKSILAESVKRLREPSFKKLCGVYLLWNMANLIMQPTMFFYFKNYVGMGPFHVSLVRGISLVGFAVSSLYWGNFSNREGHRRGLLVCLMIQNSCTLFYWLCKPDSLGMAVTAATLEQIGWGGVNLFMFPMLIDYTKGKGGGRAVGMAAFSVLLSVVTFGACLIADRHIYDWGAAMFNYFGKVTSYTSESVNVYLAVFVVAFVLRLLSLILAWTLPPCERQKAAGPGTLILRRMSEGPLRAAQAMFMSATARPNENIERQNEERQDG